MTTRINTTPTEEIEQTQLFTWARYASGKYPELELMYHIPNGGKRTKSEAARFKLQGVKPGIPDIFLPAPHGEYAGLYIELKRLQGGKVSDLQQKTIHELKQQGYYAAVCLGAEAAQKEILYYLQLPKRGDILVAYQQELCKVEYLEKRIKHLLESKLIKLFDDKDATTRDYKLDINLLDKLIAEKEVEI